jgi:hypothetical protein
LTATERVAVDRVVRRLRCASVISKGVTNIAADQ